MMRFSRFSLLVSAMTLVLAVGPGSAFAQQPAAPKPGAAAPRALPPKGSIIVVIDQGEIERDAAVFRSLRTQQEKLATAWQADGAKLERELRAADDELNKQRSILSPEAYTQKRRDLDKRFSDGQQSLQSRRRDIEQVVGDAYNKIMKQVLDIAQEIVLENDYKVILERKVAVIAQTSLDISPEVITRLNKKMSTVAVATPK